MLENIIFTIETLLDLVFNIAIYCCFNVNKHDSYNYNLCILINQTKICLVAAILYDM